MCVGERRFAGFDALVRVQWIRDTLLSSAECVLAAFVLFSRSMGELGCTQSLLPLQCTPRLTSHLSVAVRACCELSHGTFCRTCQDR